MTNEPSAAGKPLLRRLRAEDGAVTIPTIFWLPAFFMLMFFGVEMMITAIRQVLLDRAVDLTTREIRLGNETMPSHDELKKQICGVIQIVPNCTSNLAVEIFPIDTDTWTITEPNTMCTDSTSSAVLTPTIDTGTSNQLIMLRACLKVNPMSVMDPLGAGMKKDGSGRYALVSSTVFVNEPR